MAKNDDLLQLPAPEAARRLLKRFLKGARKACQRLQAGDDPEALHDFRVALRRLRSSVKAYRPWLKGVVRKSERRALKQLANSTNPARDSEVQLAWLQSLSISPRERPGYNGLLERVERHKKSAYDGLAERLVNDFGEIDARLKKRLKQAPPADDKAPRFAQVVVAQLTEALTDFETGLNEAGAHGDHATIHETRIAGKRLRYLLEPISTSLPQGKELVKTLKAAQDLLGEIHDCEVLAAELPKLARDAGAGHAQWAMQARLEEIRGEEPDIVDPMPGLMRVAELLRQRHRRALQRLHEDILRPETLDLLERLHDLTRQLA